MDSVITIRVKGGLGNQLFQYAAAYSLARRLNQELVLDTSFFPAQTLRGYKLGQLNVQFSKMAERLVFGINLYKFKYLNKTLRNMKCRTLPCAAITTYFLETCSDIITEYFTINKENIYMDGYFQSAKYFGQYRNELTEQISPNYEQEDEYKIALNDIKTCNSVAVHVRRGDFLNAQNDPNPNHYLLNEQYYYNALEYMNEKVAKSVFFWFSDDIDWVKKYFGEQSDFRYICLKTKHADIDEMMLMKNCRHIISANSTFSWWASWLNMNENAIHVCPAKRYGNLHMIPNDWIKIDIE